MDNIDLKPVKGIESWARKQFKDNHFIYYSRKGAYSYCHCAECGERYILRAIPTEDPFLDAAMDIEKPERDKETVCRKCKTRAVYKPAKHTKSEYRFKRICYGQKIDDEHFVFRIFYASQQTSQGRDTYYSVQEDERVFLEKGKKPSRYDHCACSSYFSRDYGYDPGQWYKRTIGENWYYLVHPKTYKEIAKCGMLKYVPVIDEVMSRYQDDCGLMDYYIAAARYPDFEMIIKMGLTQYAKDLVFKIPVNPNPRGKTIEDRLRVNKDRIKDLIACKGDREALQLFQSERRVGAHWTAEELTILNELRGGTWPGDWEKLTTVLEYTSPTRMKNYMKKQKMWLLDKKATWQNRQHRQDLRREYYDYVRMRKDQGYDLTNDIILFPADFIRRRNEMILEIEKTKMDKRKQEVLEKFPKIKMNYRRLSEKYSAAAGGYMIRPAKDAAEIVEEGRILHHCVGGDSYLRSHDRGSSFILFLRKAKEKDIPFITVEIRDEEIIQWYGAYDKKPNKNIIDAWLKTYTKELVKRKASGKKKTAKTKVLKTA